MSKEVTEQKQSITDEGADDVDPEGGIISHKTSSVYIIYIIIIYCTYAYKLRVVYCTMLHDGELKKQKLFVKSFTSSKLA